MEKEKERYWHKGTHIALEGSPLVGKTINQIREEIEGKIMVKVSRAKEIKVNKEGKKQEVLRPRIGNYPERRKVIDDDTPIEGGDQIELEGNENAVTKFRDKYFS